MPNGLVEGWYVGQQTGGVPSYWDGQRWVAHDAVRVGARITTPPSPALGATGRHQGRSTTDVNGGPAWVVALLVAVALAVTGLVAYEFARGPDRGTTEPLGQPVAVTLPPGAQPRPSMPSPRPTPGQVMVDPGPPVFVEQSTPIRWTGSNSYLVEGGHGTGSARSPVFGIPAPPTGRIGVSISQAVGPTTVSLVSDSGSHASTVIGTCVTSCKDTLVFSRARFLPGSYHLVITSRSPSQWEFLLVIA